MTHAVVSSTNLAQKPEPATPAETMDDLACAVEGAASSLFAALEELSCALNIFGQEDDVPEAARWVAEEADTECGSVQSDFEHLLRRLRQALAAADAEGSDDDADDADEQTLDRIEAQQLAQAGFTDEPK